MLLRCRTSSRWSPRNCCCCCCCVGIAPSVLKVVSVGLLRCCRCVFLLRISLPAIDLDMDDTLPPPSKEECIMSPLSSSVVYDVDEEEDEDRCCRRAAGASLLMHWERVIGSIIWSPSTSTATIIVAIGNNRWYYHWGRCLHEWRMADGYRILEFQ